LEIKELLSTCSAHKLLEMFFLPQTTIPALNSLKKGTFQTEKGEKKRNWNECFGE
jgi:hypothetical protein